MNGRRGENARLQRARFTLVELLVVIAIITILFAILMPSLKTAKDMAVLITCKGNLRQVFQCYTCYAGDYSGYWPAARDLNTTELYWRGFLFPYGSSKACNSANLATSIFRCPVYKTPNINLTGYGMNERLASKFFVPSGTTWATMIAKYIKPEGIPSPSFWPLVADYADNWWCESATKSTMSFNHCAQSYGNSGILYCDGHASSPKYAQYSPTPY